MVEELGDIATKTRYNGRVLLDGSSSIGQTGAFFYSEDSVADVLSRAALLAGMSIWSTSLLDGDYNVLFTPSEDDAVDGPDAKAAILTLRHILTSDAYTVIGILDNAICLVASEQAQLGAAQKRLEHKIYGLETSALGLSEADSRLRDADTVEELVSFTKARILSKANAALMAQANASAGNVLYLLISNTASSKQAAETRAPAPEPVGKVPDDNRSKQDTGTKAAFAAREAQKTAETAAGGYYQPEEA